MDHDCLALHFPLTVPVTCSSKKHHGSNLKFPTGERRRLVTVARSKESRGLHTPQWQWVTSRGRRTSRPRPRVLGRTLPCGCLADPARRCQAKPVAESSGPNVRTGASVRWFPPLFPAPVSRPRPTSVARWSFLLWAWTVSFVLAGLDCFLSSRGPGLFSAFIIFGPTLRLTGGSIFSFPLEFGTFYSNIVIHELEKITIFIQYKCSDILTLKFIVLVLFWM